MILLLPYCVVFAAQFCAWGAWRALSPAAPYELRNGKKILRAADIRAWLSISNVLQLLATLGVGLVKLDFMLALCTYGASVWIHLVVLGYLMYFGRAELTLPSGEVLRCGPVKWAIFWSLMASLALGPALLVALIFSSGHIG